MNTISIILCVIGSAAIAGFIWWWKWRQDTPNKFNQFTGKMPNNYFAKSAAGVYVFSESQIKQAQLADIDAGIAETLRRAARDYPTATLPTHADFTVWLWPQSSKCPQGGVYQVFGGNNPYDQGVYDLDDTPGKTGLCYAGRMILDGKNNRLGMLLCDTMIKIGAQFEAEHNVLFRIDRARYFKTADLHQHPIFPDDANKLTTVAKLAEKNGYKCLPPLV